MPAINELSVSVYLCLPRTKTNLIRAQTGFGGIFEVIHYRFISIMIVQTKCKLNKLFVRVFYIQSKEIADKKYHEGNRDNWKIGQSSSD